MAADIKITADISDLQVLKRELLDIPKKAKDSASVFEREYAKVERQISRLATAHQKYYKDLQQASLANKSAAQSAAVFEKSLKDQERELDRLRTKYNPLYAASKLYERSLHELKTAQDINAISAAQYRQELDLLEAEYREFATGAASATNRFSQAASRGSRGISRVGVLTQQAGYQVGDFIVQVQSGTNAFVAFGQQATQVAGTLTLLGGKWIGIGTALGIAIPLLTAAGAAFMRTRQQAREAAEGVTDFQQALDSLDNSLNSWLRTMEAARMGISVDELLGIGGVEAAEENLRRELQRLSEIRERIAEQEATSGVRDEAGRAAALAEQEAAIQAVADAEERLANVRERQAQQQTQNFVERQVELQNEIDLLRAIAEYGEDSLEVIELRANQALQAEIRRIRALVESNQITEAMGVQLTQAAAQASALTVQAELQALAFSLASEEIDRVQAAIEAVARGNFNTLTEQIAAVTAATGLAADEALRWLQTLNLAIDSAPEIRGPDQAIEETRSRFNLDPIFVRNYPARGSSGAGGGGGAGGTSYTDIINRMEQEVQQRLEILRLSERQQRVREIELEILNQIEGEVDAVTAAEIRGAAERINAIEMQVSELERLREQQEHLAQTIGNAFGDAMTSIITGTEDAGDAFRNMARRIVAELFDVLVVQRMVANLTQAIGGIGGGSSGGGGGFLGNLLGGLFGGRASGGTMNANQPYLVGERGPEIVMPGRQSTVMNSNLSAQAMGGTQQVDVRVFVDDNGNFDAKVERISSNTVRSAAPAIVQQSVGAVVDQRRRGGAMKGVFG